MAAGTVGLIGLGIMGGAIAKNLAAAGWHVIGFDLDEARMREAAQAGIERAADIADVAARAPVIITSLPSAAAVAGAAASIAAQKEPRLVIEASTLALSDKFDFERVLSAAGHVALDCPLSGTGAQAKTRDLVVYASGDSGKIAQAMPALQAFSREVHDVGAYGNGTRMKLIANLLVAINNVASAEAMVLGRKSGLDPHQIVKLVSAGAGNSRIFELRAPMMADGNFEPATMKIGVWQKDMQVIRQFAEDLACDTPLFSASEWVYEAALDDGLAALDTAAVYRILAKRAGLAD